MIKIFRYIIKLADLCINVTVNKKYIYCMHLNVSLSKINIK